LYPLFRHTSPFQCLPGYRVALLTFVGYPTNFLKRRYYRRAVLSRSVIAFDCSAFRNAPIKRLLGLMSGWQLFNTWLLGAESCILAVGYPIGVQIYSERRAACQGSCSGGASLEHHSHFKTGGEPKDSSSTRYLSRRGHENCRNADRSSRSR
jgi:hypothetical protein